MTVGPFDFEVPTGPSEYGGEAGWMQPNVTPAGTPGHQPTPSEENNITMRGAMHWSAEEETVATINGRDVVIAQPFQDSIDPVTGLPVPLAGS
jgi:hypothetical protein